MKKESVTAKNCLAGARYMFGLDGSHSTILMRRMNAKIHERALMSDQTLLMADFMKIAHDMNSAFRRVATHYDSSQG